MDEVDVEPVQIQTPEPPSSPTKQNGPFDQLQYGAPLTMDTPSTSSNGGVKNGHSERKHKDKHKSKHKEKKHKHHKHEKVSFDCSSGS